MTAIKPGPELDALIEQKIMFTVKDRIKWVERGCYSRSMADVWKVVHRIQFNTDPLGRAWKLELRYGGTDHEWYAAFELENDTAGDDRTFHHAYGQTAPHAICLAALKVVEDKP